MKPEFQKRLAAAVLGLLTLLPATGAESTDLATERLGDIVEREVRFYERIRNDPDFYSASEVERRVGDILEAYQSFLADNPDDVEALILYGKLLRRVDEPEAAFGAFLKADALDPKIAVVKQQIGTYLAETGKAKSALPFYLQAVELEPDTAVYHFGLGQLLAEFRDTFLKEAIFTPDALDREMLKAFRKAAQLDPDNFDFQMRLGEAYYDLSSPDWKGALLHWNALAKHIDDPLRIEIVNLHRARVLGELGRHKEARELANSIEDPALQFSKEQVLQYLSLH